MAYLKNTVKTGIIVNTDKFGFTLETAEGFFEVEYKGETPKTCKAVKVFGNSYKPGFITDAEIEYLNEDKGEKFQ
jgi:hypothetical protein